MSCYYCGGEGIVITCIDDLCIGAGECMHGDGESACPVCNGYGHADEYEFYEDDPEAA